MKKETLKIEDLINSINADVLNKQIEFDGCFRSIIKNRFERISKYELSLSQRRRTLALVNYLSLGYRKSKFDYCLIVNAVETFIKLTNDKDKETVRTIYESLIKVPKWLNPKRVKGINSNEKSRDN